VSSRQLMQNVDSAGLEPTSMMEDVYDRPLSVELVVWSSGFDEQRNSEEALDMKILSP